MKREKLFLAWLLSLIVLSTFPMFLPQVKAQSFVIETVTSITIENSYYKAIFDIDQANGYGRIRYFYIKPNDIVNVIPTGIWRMWAGHEILTANGTTETDPRDWSLLNFENMTCSVEYNSGGIAIVKVDKWWKTYAEGYYQAHFISYWAFYQDKPYFIESHQRIYMEDMSYIFNHDTCYFLDDAWVSNYKTLWENGTLAEDNQPINSESLRVEEASRLGKYPWAYLYNTTYNKGIGWILLSADPTTTMLWAYYRSAGNYVEMQIESNIEAVQAGQSEYFTLMTYITGDYTDVDNVATTLLSTQKSNENFLKTVQFNENKPTSGGARGQITNPLRIYYAGGTTTLSNYWMYNGYGSLGYAKYKNSTGTYDLWQWSAITWEDYFWNGTYGTATFQHEFQNKIRFRWKLEVWSDSEVLRHTLNFTTMAAVNITSLYFSSMYLTGQANQKLNASVIKNYDYDPTYYETGWVEEVGTAYMNMSGCVKNVAMSLYTNFYALDQTEAEVPSGTSYVMQIKEQFYYRLLSEGLGAFNYTDILDYGESTLNRFHNLTWNKFPLHANRDFAIKHYGHGYLLAGGSYDGDDLLSFVVAGPSGTASSIQVYVGDKGEPISVTGADSYSYNSERKILNVNVLHTSSKEVIIYFADHAPPRTTINLSGVLGNNDWFTSEVTVALSATDDISGVDKTEYSSDNVTWTTYAKPFNITHEGNIVIHYKSTDREGNIEIVRTATIKIDKTPPSASIVINDETNYTTVTAVTLTVSATDETSGIAEIRFSNDDITYTEWQTCTSSKSWNLEEGDGTKTVYLQFRDNAGLMSPTYHDMIILDATKPKAKAGQNLTANVNETVTFAAGRSTDNIGIISFEWDFGDGESGTGVTVAHTYSSPGTYTAILTVRDAAGNSDLDSLVVTVTTPTEGEGNSSEGLPLWILGAVTAMAAIGVVLGTFFLRKRRSHASI